MTTPIRITNCHTHLFTSRHVPRYFPHWSAFPLKAMPLTVRAISLLARAAGQERTAENINKIYRFQNEGRAEQQRDIFLKLRRQYPRGTRFVVLPMDLSLTGHGPVPQDLRDQHRELADLAADPAFDDTIIPFATIHPDRPDGAEICLHALEELNFRGLKLYPSLGFPPDHPVLMDRIYPVLERTGKPVMSHCSRGGVKARHIARDEAERFAAPAAMAPVLKAFPKLNVCLAHFGGDGDWHSYVNTGIDPDDEGAKSGNWQVQIRRMIRSGDYPNLWTDISYTLFHIEDNLPFLKHFLCGPTPWQRQLRERVLFGSDYYMTRKETLSERAICFRLRNELGEDVFRQIAETNPRVWLGEPKATAPA